MTENVSHALRFPAPRLLALSLLLASSLLPTNQARAQKLSAARRDTTRASIAPRDLERNIRAHMEFLASDALAGRGSATEDELIAAEYIASQLRQFGVEPAGDPGTNGDRSYIQNVTFAADDRRRADAPQATQSEGTAQPRSTRNVIGVLPGVGAPRQRNQVVLLSAHMDHLGTRLSGEETDGADRIYNGADDDASGTVAVLELARALATGRRPSRTVMFVFFGSEETGGQGATEFLRRPPVPLERIVANLEFEMIGRPDPKIAEDELWLTGYERSNLGAELARRGARLVADPHPEQNFFRRSDNYQLARRGVVAHTVSSFGLHAEYHTPGDDLAHIDFRHMTRAVGSMIEPVRRLANSNFIPTWAQGGKP